MLKTAQEASIVVPTTRITPYMRVRLTTDDEALAIEYWRALFVFLPLRRHRVEIPLAELASGRITSLFRVDCLAAAVAIAMGIVWLTPPPAVTIPLGLLGLLQLAFTTQAKAAHLERTDGRAWTLPFCRDYAFDVSVAILDAQRREHAPLQRHRSGSEQ